MTKSDRHISIIDPSIDKRWDEFAISNSFGYIYHTSLWKEIIETAFPHIKAMFLAIINKESDKIIAGLPLYYVKSWLLGNRFVSVPYATACSPLVNDCQELGCFINHILNLNISEFKRTKGFELRNFRKEDKFDLTGMKASTFHKYHYLLLGKNINETMSRFDRHVRQNIKKAEGSNLKLHEVTSENELKIFYKLYVRHRQEHCLPPHPYRFIHLLWEKLYPKGHLDVMLLDYENKFIGGILQLKFKDRVSLELLVTDKNYLNIRPNNMLVWGAIKKAIAEGYNMFDFGRTHVSNNGLLRFKRNWGTIEEDLYMIISPCKPINNIVNQNNAIVKNLLRYLYKPLPLWASKIIGEFVYSHFA